MMVVHSLFRKTLCMLLALFLFASLYGEYNRIHSVYQIPLQYIKKGEEKHWHSFIHGERERKAFGHFMHGEGRLRFSIGFSFRRFRVTSSVILLLPGYDDRFRVLPVRIPIVFGVFILFVSGLLRPLFHRFRVTSIVFSFSLPGYYVISR
jgi:hypothetical protein